MSDHEHQFSHFRHHLVLKVVNELSFLAFFATNIFILATGHVYGHGKPTYFTAASMTSGIWTVVQFIFMGTMVYQWTNSGSSVLIDCLHFRLATIFTLATVHLHLWYHQQWLAAFFFAAFLFVAVAETYYVVKKWYPARGIYDEALVHTPIAMFQAWTTFLAIELAFEAFGENPLFGASNWTKVYVVLSIAVLTLVSVAYAFTTPEGDFIAGINITWTLYGLSRRQSGHGLFGLVTLAAEIITFLLALNSAYRFYRLKYNTLKNSARGSDVERATLMGSND